MTFFKSTIDWDESIPHNVCTTILWRSVQQVYWIVLFRRLRSHSKTDIIADIYIYRVFRLIDWFLSSYLARFSNFSFFLCVFDKLWSEFCKRDFWTFRLIDWFLSTSAILRKCWRGERWERREGEGWWWWWWEGGEGGWGEEVGRGGGGGGGGLRKQSFCQGRVWS